MNEKNRKTASGRKNLRIFFIRTFRPSYQNDNLKKNRMKYCS